jgi:L-lactate dehydrogenase complex protein LldG
MDSNKAKKQILQSIKKGLEKAKFKKIETRTVNNKDIFITPDKPLLEIFKDELTNIKGEFHCFINNEELINILKEIHSKNKLELCYSPDPKFLNIIAGSQIKFTEKFENPDAIKSGISSCEYLVARFGSVMVSSALPGGRRIFSFPEIHIVIAEENQLVLEIEEALSGIQLKYGTDLPSQITNITGPSRTADIEKTLILGAHGPKQLIVLVHKS